MPGVELKREGEIAYREVIPDEPSGADPVLLVHGFPQSSYICRTRTDSTIRA